MATRPATTPRLPEATVSEYEGVRSLHLGTVWIQGSMRIAKPDFIELDYVQRMLASLLWLHRLVQRPYEVVVVDEIEFVLAPDHRNGADKQVVGKPLGILVVLFLHPCGAHQHLRSANGELGRCQVVEPDLVHPAHLGLFVAPFERAFNDLLGHGVEVSPKSCR